MTLEFGGVGKSAATDAVKRLGGVELSFCCFGAFDFVVSLCACSLHLNRFISINQLLIKCDIAETVVSAARKRS